MDLEDTKKELISAYVDHELDPIQRRNVEARILSTRSGMEYYLNTVLLKHLIREAYRVPENAKDRPV